MKDTDASYNVSLLIAEAGKPYSIDEKLVKSAANMPCILTRLLHSQLDESTEIGNEANVLCFVRCIYASGVQDDFLFYLSLPTNTTEEAVFHLLKDFIMKNNRGWSRLISICTYSATAMTGK